MIMILNICHSFICPRVAESQVRTTKEMPVAEIHYGRFLSEKIEALGDAEVPGMIELRDGTKCHPNLVVVRILPKEVYGLFWTQ